MISSQVTLLVLYIVLGLLTSHISTKPTAFVVQPVSINTTEGSKEVFTYLGNNSLDILCIVDYEKFLEPNTIYKGFLVEYDYENPQYPPFGVVGAKITVTASSTLNNNSVIVCILDNRDAPPGFITPTQSRKVILRVQGPLSQVGDLSYSFIDYSTIAISWNPPFTLPGTNITGYNISAATSDGTTTKYFTSNSYYKLSLTDITDSPCEVITISISGYNGVDGESITFKAPSSMMSLPITLLIETYNSLFVSFNSTQLCPIAGKKHGSYVLPESINITLISNNDIINQTSIAGSQLLLLNGDRVGFNGFPVQSDHTYTVNISFNGLYSYMESVEIDTHDLVSARVLNSSDSTVCVECVFSPFSSDNSCTVELVSSNHTTTRQQFMLYRPPNNNDTDDSNIVRDCFDLEIEGNFTLRVLEQSSTRVRRSHNIGTIPTKDTSSSLSSYPSIAEYQLPVLAIAGIVVVCIIFVIMTMMVIPTWSANTVSSYGKSLGKQNSHSC